MAVVRRHVLGDAERSVWAAVGRGLAAACKGLGLVLLYLLRLVLAPPSTSAGLRRIVLNAAPLPDASRPPAECRRPARAPAIDPAPSTEPPELAGASKRARLAWWYERDAAYGDRSAVAAAAKRLAPRGRPQRGDRPGVHRADPRRPGEGRRGVMMRLAAAGVVLVLLAALFLRFTAFSGDRIRAIRWRIRLRLHPGPGFASVGELWFRWSRHAAISHGRRARPGLRFRHRLRSRTTDYAVRLGRGQWFRRAYARMEDQVLVMAAQRTGQIGDRR